MKLLGTIENRSRRVCCRNSWRFKKI